MTCRSHLFLGLLMCLTALRQNFAGTEADWKDPCDESGIDVPYDSSHALFGEVLQANVRPNGTLGGIQSSLVDYNNIRKDDSKLRRYLRSLCKINATALTTEEYAAALCNAYNALMLLIVVHFRPVESVRQISVSSGAIWTQQLGTLGGAKVSLDNIEHNTMRAGISAKLRAEGLAHTCFVCASLSCPDLQTTPFVGATFVQTLSSLARAWLANPTKNVGGNPLRLSKIFSWYGGDFVAQSGSIPAFVRAYTNWSVADDVPISFLDYNWALNDLQGSGAYISAASPTSLRFVVESTLATAILAGTFWVW